LNILISTGDSSGDFIGSLLLKRLKELSPNIFFYAIGGEKLRAAGAKVLEDSSTWSAIGIFDALSKVPRVYLASRRIRKKLPHLNLNGVIYIDCPAFNLYLAQAIVKLGIPSVYFFPPSQWRNDPKRAAKVGKLVNRVIAPFTQASKVYQEANVPVFFSGHPLLDILESEEKSEVIFRELGLDRNRPVVGLFPGSRDQEIHYLLPLELAAARKLLAKIPKLQFVLPISRKNLEKTILHQIRSSGLPVVARTEINHKVMQIADFLILASGTATLEATLFRKPMVIVYKVSPLTWRLERPLLKGVKFAGLPNLLAGKEIVPELMQEKATVNNLVNHALKLLTDESARKQMIALLESLRPQLGEPGVIDRVSHQILETFGG